MREVGLNVRLLSAGPFVTMIDRFAFAPILIPIAIAFRAPVGAVAIAATAYYMAYGLALFAQVHQYGHLFLLAAALSVPVVITAALTRARQPGFDAGRAGRRGGGLINRPVKSPPRSWLNRNSLCS